MNAILYASGTLSNGIYILDMSNPILNVNKGQRCDAPKPGSVLTNHQLAKNLWISGDPILHCYILFNGIHNFNKNQKKSPLYRELYPKFNLYKT